MFSGSASANPIIRMHTCNVNMPLESFMRLQDKLKVTAMLPGAAEEFNKANPDQAQEGLISYY